MKPMEYEVKTVRRIAITKQHLQGRLPSSPGPSAIMNIVKDMRYVQIDPTSAVAPSHLLVLWSRLGNFRESDLDKLLWKDRKLFENWAHEASIVLTEDYPLYASRMRGFATSRRVWGVRIRQWMKENQGLRKRVLSELRERGPLSSRDFEDTSQRRWDRARKQWGLKKSAWSEGRDVSTMLEFLFHQGEVLVAGRQGRQKLWDLSEKVLPSWTPRTELSSDEVEQEGAQFALKALGVATPKQIGFHFLTRRFRDVRKTLPLLESDGKAIPVSLKGVPPSKEKWYIHADDVELAEDISKGEFEPRTTLLSPFDNLIIDRDRTHFLWNYFFRIEIYTPKHLRKHGYFVMSILDGDRIVGRLDPVMDRQNEKLVIKAMHAEPSAPEGRAPAARVAAAVEDLGQFLGAKEVVYPSRVPEPWKAYLM